MSSVPAWKRIGLSVKKDADNDSLSVTTTRVENADLTTKQIKKISNKTKTQQTKNRVQKKPPKRIKLPKSERPPPPVKDQLTYLKQYETDRVNWKFNKLKQNWVLKNIKEIPSEYELALLLYIESLQGGSRDRIIPILKDVISKWNVQYEEAERKIEEEISKKLDSNKKAEAEEEGKKEQTGEKQEDDKSKESSIDLGYAIRCKAILEKLVDEHIILKGNTQEDNESVEEEEEEEVKPRDNLIINHVDV